LVKKMRALGEQVFEPSATDSARFLEMFPDAARIGFSYGSGQFDGANDRRTRRERRIAADAASAEAGRSLAADFPGIENIGVGDPWRSRR
jgi:hypothetical protein